MALTRHRRRTPPLTRGTLVRLSGSLFLPEEGGLRCEEAARTGGLLTPHTSHLQCRYFE